MKKKSTSTFRLDEQVYMAMFAVAFVSLLIFGFRFVGRHPCPPLTLQIQSNTDSFKAGNLISFVAETQEGSNFSWNYGDGVRDDGTSPTTLHKFTRAGTFTVSVTVNDKCTEFQSIVITEDRIPDNNLFGTLFIGPEKAYMGMPVPFTDLSNKSAKWEWHYEDDPMVGDTTKSVTHVFKTPGLKKVTLMINDRRDLVQTRYVFIVDREAENNLAKESELAHAPKHTAPRVIVVPSGPTVPPLSNPTQPAKTVDAPKKEEEKPVQKAPELTHTQMEGFLMDLIAGSKQIEDFNPYLCGNLSMPVVYNSNNTTFLAMCNSLKQLKKKKVKSIKVTLFPNTATNCQQSMMVYIDIKKGILSNL
jgi:hypothetical protein